MDVTQFPTIDQSHRLWPLFCPRPTVRIAFYTDSASVLDANADFGTTRLRDLIHAANTFYADFQIDIVNRFDGATYDGKGQLHATRTLTAAFLDQYDQVWFFGIKQFNIASEPDNELSDDEVDALRVWMVTGGVLMTGDHANPNPDAANNGLDPLVNLGRALGHRVPRAGELRKWEGLPSSDTGFTAPGDPLGPRTNHNTQQPKPGINIDDLALQSDATPQPLLLKRYPLWSAHPFFERDRPHPLFCGRSGPIEVFPDHMHEGMIVIPPNLGGDWPGGTNVPEVVASGRDTRTGRVWPVVAVYDGLLSGVGRIVADSTWHHYFNVNLQGLVPGSPEQLAIADYYVNLAVWLTPQAKRDAMRCSVLWWLLNQDAVNEVALQPYWIIGDTAFDVLGRTAGRCTIIDLVLRWPDFVLVEDQRPPRPWPPEEWIIGGILHEYQRAAVLDDTIGERTQLQRRGIANAARQHAEILETAAKDAIAFLDGIEKVLER